jgi:hypothetical protein
VLLKFFVGASRKIIKEEKSNRENLRKHLSILRDYLYLMPFQKGGGDCGQSVQVDERGWGDVI